MNITILQTDILWAQPEANRQRISQLIEHLGPTDLIVLPEMFSTGFAAVDGGDGGLHASCGGGKHRHPGG